jgi:hypothetical protein
MPQFKTSGKGVNRLIGLQCLEMTIMRLYRC